MVIRDADFFVTTWTVVRLTNALFSYVKPQVLALERFSLECRIKPKPKQTLRPITTDADNPMSQTELEANTCNRRQARENVREQVMIGFGLLLIGWE